MKPFIHLHLHSEFSLLDSSLHLAPLIQKAKEYDMPAVALTDHGNILGAVNFYKKAKKSDLKPIIGSELYIAPESRFDKPDKKLNKLNYHHLVALVKNKTGYRNLSELITKSFLEGFYRKPRIDKELLEKHKDGLIIMSACIQGEIPYLLLHNAEEKAYEAAKWYREMFKDDFYLEVQNHGLPSQIEVLPKLVQMSRDLSIPLVASNDVHYLNKGDADAREVLICLQTNNVLSNENRAMKKQTEEMYFKSGDEMYELFSDIPEALDITNEIAAKCNFGFKLGDYSYPEFEVPKDMTIDGFFEQICREGYNILRPNLLEKRHPIDEYDKRLDYEINKIREMGFPGYFLIVWDIIKFSKDSGIGVGPGRGSVVGSLVAYSMGITTVDPLEYDLLFERFLNPERISMPDIDLDFDPDRRYEIIEYIREKYGEECVCQIVTFGKMKAKMAIRDIGRVLEIPLSTVNKLAKMIPEGPKSSLQTEIKENKELIKAVETTENATQLMDFALKLENNVRHTSMHAAGVVIAPKKLTEFMPLYKTRDDIVSQYEKEEVEEIGLLKLDILGLKTLTIIKNIIAQIKDIKGIDLDIENVSIFDEKTYEIFQKGDTDGIFQFESSGMRDFLKRSKPNKIEDLIALNALYRPGPLESGMADRFVERKSGREPITYIFDELESLLADTYGIIVYQEQVMLIAVTIAGFTLGGADGMRKIMGKKQEDKIAGLEKEFIAGALKKGFDKKKVIELFSQIKTFARYGFNKSHSTAYAFLAYQTAFLKAHYPVFFMAAHLTNESGKTSTTSKVIQYISECKKMKLEILNPSINKSFENFRAETMTTIRYGLKGLKNVGDAALKSIITSREEKGLFTGFTDFIQKIDLSKVNKAVIESLIKSGAMDEFNLPRKVMFNSIENLIKQAAILEKSANSNQMSLFGASAEHNSLHIPPDTMKEGEWEESEIIKGEKEIAGMYISHNPIDKYHEDIEKISNTNIAKINIKEFTEEKVRIGGVITDVNERKSKKGTYYGEIFFEDFSGRIKILVFNASKKKWNGNNKNSNRVSWDDIKSSIIPDTPYFLEATLPDSDDPTPNLYLTNIISLDKFLKRKAKKIVIKIKQNMLNNNFNNSLHEKLEEHKDSVPYIIAVYSQDGFRTLIEGPEDRGLMPTTRMKKDIESVTGKDSVEIIYF